LRSVRSPHENRIGFGFPCSGAERDLRGSFSSRQVREVREGWFPVFRCGLCGLCVRFLRGVGRRVAGCGAEPRQTNQTTCGRVPLDAAKQAGAALCSGRALCSFSTRSTTRLVPATPSLVRAKAGSGDAPRGPGPTHLNSPHSPPTPIRGRFHCVERAAQSLKRFSQRAT
jgi:hypothetical protein